MKQKFLLLIAPFAVFLLDIITRWFLKFGKKISGIYTFFWFDLNQDWFDHRYDYLRGADNFYWQERGFWANSIIKKRDLILDIGCAEGFFTAVYYANKAKQVDAIDLSSQAIKFARRSYHLPNINYIHADINNFSFPKAKYHKVFMFVTLERMTETDGLNLLTKIEMSLIKNGIFFGSTPIFQDDKIPRRGNLNEFSSVKNLRKFLKSSFRDSNIEIFTSQWPSKRLETYFKCTK